jgi:hypothetical protein
MDGLMGLGLNNRLGFCGVLKMKGNNPKILHNITTNNELHNHPFIEKPTNAQIFHQHISVTFCAHP